MSIVYYGLRIKCKIFYKSHKIYSALRPNYNSNFYNFIIL